MTGAKGKPERQKELVKLIRQFEAHSNESGDPVGGCGECLRLFEALLSEADRLEVDIKEQEASAQRSAVQEQEQTSQPCGESVRHFIAGASSFACVLPKGHSGEHRSGGDCYQHGRYVTEQEIGMPMCPKCPENFAAQSLDTLEQPDVLRMVISDVVSAWAKTGDFEMLKERLHDRIAALIRTRESTLLQQFTQAHNQELNLATASRNEQAMEAALLRTERDANTAAMEELAAKWKQSSRQISAPMAKATFDICADELLLAIPPASQAALEAERARVRLETIEAAVGHCLCVGIDSEGQLDNCHCFCGATIWLAHPMSKMYPDEHERIQIRNRGDLIEKWQEHLRAALAASGDAAKEQR